MKKITKQQETHLHNLRMMVFATRDAVYRAADRDDVPLSECMKICREDVRDKYTEAVGVLVEFESSLVQQGRGYFDQFGHFRSY